MRGVGAAPRVALLVWLGWLGGPGGAVAQEVISAPGGAAAAAQIPALVQAASPAPLLDRAPGCQQERNPGLSYDPVAVGFYDADLGTGHRACPRSEVRLGARLGAIIATAQFYGDVAASALISGSYAFGGRGEIFATLEGVHFEYVQNATLEGTTIGLGQMTLGGAVVALMRQGVTLTPYIKALLPTSTLTPHVVTLGGEIGAAVDYRPTSRLDVHGFVGADLSAGISAAPAQPRAGVLAGAGIGWAPLIWLALALDLDGHFAYQSTVDYIAPALALRFRLYRTLNLELDGTAPLAGADRHAVLALLSLGCRL